MILAVTVFLRLYHLSSLPLGLRYDEAYNGIDILAVFRGEHPVFFVGNFGREPLFIYLQAFSVALLGQTTFALRAVATAFGILTVLASYALACRLFSRRVGLFTAAWLSVSLWHVMFSRIGLRTISLPFFGCAMVYCLWRGLESPNIKVVHPTADVARNLRPSLPWFAASGLVLGLSLYTYTAARLLPVIVAAFAVYLACVASDLFRRCLPGLILAASIAVVVFAPEAAFFVQHPEMFGNRIGGMPSLDRGMNEVDVVSLARSAERTLGMFNLAGDRNWDRNIPGRPIFDPASSLLMGFGLVLAVARWRQPAFGLLLIWLAGTIVPGILVAGDPPNFLHFTGLIPAVFILPALAVEWLWDRWERAVTPRWRTFPPVLFAMVFVAGAVLTYRDYFDTWAHSPEVAFLFDSDRWLTLDVARQMARSQASPILIGAGSPDDPMERYALERQTGPRQIHAFDGSRSLPLLPSGRLTTYLYSARDLPPAVVRERAFGATSSSVVAKTPAGGMVLRQDVSGSRPRLVPDHRVTAQAGNTLELLGFDVPTEAYAGKAVTVRWYWRLLRADARQLTFFNQLFDASGQRRGQLDDRPFPPDYWPPATSGVTWFDIDVDKDAQTGPLTLWVGVYDRDSMERLPLIDPNGQGAGQQLALGPIKVHGTAPAAPSVVAPKLAHFADQIDLLGYSVTPVEPGSEGSVTLTLDWGARGRPWRDYTVFVHLLDDRDVIVAQGDAPPGGGHYPTSIWDAGEVIADPHVILDPADQSSGSYRFAIGLYNPATGDRLATLDASGKAVGDTVFLNWPAR